jgi:hypothetical protein
MDGAGSGRTRTIDELETIEIRLEAQRQAYRDEASRCHKAGKATLAVAYVRLADKAAAARDRVAAEVRKALAERAS